ncbi:MAG: matrixin family metalloprotease, partial [Verrucomicrobiales bacterium]|nr:matrixin family metalloprotease [Verrucomicrobiales bacterium]
MLTTLSDEELIERLPDKERRSLTRYRDELESSPQEASPYICWSPGTAPAIVEAYRRVEREFGLSSGKMRPLATQFLGIGHWSNTATDGSGQGVQGLPVTVTWSIVPDGTDAPDRGGGAAASSNLQAWLAGIYGTAAGAVENQPWFPLFQEAFDNIAAQSGLRLVYEPNDDGAAITNFSSGRGILGVRGDIRLSSRDIDGDFGVLAFAYSPNYGDVVIDSTDVFFNTTSSNSIRLINTLTHELGHALGLGHVCPIDQTKLMEPFITMAFRGCQFDDTYSLQRQYADKLEIHSGLRNNDTAANATPVSLVPGATSTWRWLSNDDSSDVDYLRFSGLAGQSLTAQVIPSDPIAPTDPGVDTYLEGAQNSDGTCSTGNDFNPTTQQDLTLELLGENGSTVLAGSTSAPAGETESIASFVLPSNGSYYLRINGGSADAAQLYKLEALLENAPPTPRLQVDSTRLIAESNSAANSVADPDETVRIGVTLSNQGDFAANNVVATMTGPSGFTGFETSATLGSLAASANTELLFLFAQNGQCGDTIQLTLNITADGGYSESLTIPLELGSVGQASLIDEGFDGGSSLPSGWSQSATGSGSAWETSTARADSPSQSAFSAGISNAGEALLFSPPMTIGTSGSTLSFRHYYDLQNRVDGAVLEASLDGGTWFDLLNSAATVVSGAYNNSIRGNVN